MHLSLCCDTKSLNPSYASRRPGRGVIDANPSAAPCQLSANHVFDSDIGIVGTESIKAGLSRICIAFKLIQITGMER